MKAHHFYVAAVFCLFSAALTAQTKVDFKNDVAPVLEQNCVQCHHQGETTADLEMTSRKDLLEQRTVVPGNPDKSILYTIKKTSSRLTRFVLTRSGCKRMK